MPPYELEGDGCSSPVIVNSTARFRLRLLSSTLSHHTPTVDAFALSILDPHAHEIVVQRRVLSSDLLELTYQPMSAGKHQLSIHFNHRIDRQMTIDVIHDESNYLSKLRPFGPGLRRAVAGLPTEFYVDLNQTTNQNIHFRLEPSYQAEIDYEQQMATVRYVPSGEGDCPVHILEDDRDIPLSPFFARIDRNSSVRGKPRIRVFGLSKDIILHRPVEFEVSCTLLSCSSRTHLSLSKVFIDNPSDDSTQSLSVDILTEDQQSPTVSIRARHRSSYVCSFVPVSLGRHWISVDYAGIVAEHNPFYSRAAQGKDILLMGPAINDQCLSLHQPTHFSFKMKDILNSIVTPISSLHEQNYTYESGYSSNDDISTKSSLSSSSTDILAYRTEEDNNYRVTITDGHGNLKPNVLVHDVFENSKENDVRVDFTPDEQILYINISCTW